jgi:ABC-type uncharacterized transport system permease subunit
LNDSLTAEEANKVKIAITGTAGEIIFDLNSLIDFDSYKFKFNLYAFSGFIVVLVGFMLILVLLEKKES